MITPRDPDRLIRAFLDEGPEILPDRTYDALRDSIDRTRQRVVIGPWKEPHMQNFAKLAIATAAVVVVAFVGIRVLPGQPGAGGIGPGLSLSPSPSISASPTASPRATPAPYFPAEGPLAAGAYDAISEYDMIPYSFTVPDGWTSVGGWFLTNDPESRLRLAFLPVWNLYSDPCQGTLASPAVGPSVDDLATALGALPGTSANTTQDVTVDGRAAKLVEYTVREDNRCLNDRFYLSRSGPDGDFWTWPPYGDLVRTWILDVDGKRFVITADIQPGLSETDKAELQDVIDSVTIGG